MIPDDVKIPLTIIRAMLVSARKARGAAYDVRRTPAEQERLHQLANALFRACDLSTITVDRRGSDGT